MVYELVEPADPPPLFDVARTALEGFVPARCEDWLAAAVVFLAQESEARIDDDERQRRSVRQCCLCLKASFERESQDEAFLDALLNLPRYWLQEHPEAPERGERYLLYQRLFEQLVPRWKKHWKETGWSAALLRLWKRGPGAVGEAVLSAFAAQALLQAGTITLEEILDTAELVDRRWGGQEDVQSGPETLEFWVRVVGPTVVTLAPDLVNSVPDERRGVVALAILEIVGRMRSAGRGPFEPALVAFVRFLSANLDRHRDDLLFAGAYWTGVLADGVANLLTDAERAEAAQSALRALGRLRRQTEAGDAELPAADGPILYSRAVSVLATLQGAWNAFQPLLLLLRSLHVQVVRDDLGIVPEGGELAAPPNWSWLGHSYMSLINVVARREQKQDPALIAFREAFARFCLNRLRTKKSKRNNDEPRGEDMTEPDPTWRTCYVRAVRELKANPEQRGHHALHWALRNDPDESVRSAARTAYGEVRKTSSRLPPDMSPRRLVFAALWWLRQAHVFTVGGTVDPQGARRTRQQELHDSQVLHELDFRFGQSDQD